MDGLYLADGPWGTDYLEDYASVTRLNISNEDINDEEGAHEINRNIEVQGEVKGNINVFRHVLPGDQTLNVRDYNFITRCDGFGSNYSSTGCSSSLWSININGIMTMTR